MHSSLLNLKHFFKVARSTFFVYSFVQPFASGTKKYTEDYHVASANGCFQAGFACLACAYRYCTIQDAAAYDRTVESRATMCTS